MTKIEWTEKSWNPIVGCSIISPGCTNCYAMKMAGRVEATGHPAYQGLTQKAKTGFVWTGKLALNEKALLEPLNRTVPTTYFVNSMGDLFHEDCPDELIDRVFAVMALCPQHTFQVLTKRSARMREYFSRATAPHGRMENVWLATSEFAGVSPAIKQMVCNDLTWGKMRGRWPLPNVWLGVSVEDQQRADERIPDLLATPAAVRWISAEPLLGPVNLNSIHEVFDDGCLHTWESALDGKRFSPWVGDDEDPMIPGFPKLDWVVAGGESGKGARPMHPDWARSLRDQCAAADVPFFFKQWGEWYPAFANNYAVEASAVRETRDLGGAIIHRLGKKRAGRLLDGVEHNGMPNQ
jgi:protein gp37